MRHFASQRRFVKNFSMQVGQKVRQEFGVVVMEIVDFEPDLVENVIVRWEDPEGNIITGKFAESQLELAED